MAVATFDTLKFANTLKSAGVPDKQAEAQAVAFSEILQVNMKDLATKDDLKQAVTELKQEINIRIDGVNSRMETRFEKVEGRIDAIYEKLHGEHILLRWMIGVGLIGTMSLVIRSFLFRGAI